MSEEKELPEGWVKTELGMIGVWVGGGTPSKEKEQFWTDGTIPWVSPKDMKTLRIRDTEDHLSVSALEETVLKLCPVGTVLIVVRSGILERTLPVAIAQTPVTMNQDMKGICPESGIEPMYTAYYLIYSDRDIRSCCSKNGTTVASIETGMLKSYPIFFPPLTEQQRIISAIEERFTILDAVTKTLQQDKQKLKRTRASVLKHAVEGKLTGKWRAEHPATESGQQLLERILTERRAKWEAEQLAKGKDPRKLRYEEPTGPDTSELQHLPKEWCWATVEQLASTDKYALAIGPFGSNLKVEDYRKEGVPLVFVRNIRSNIFDGPDTRYISKEKANELRPHQVESGDILITKMGDPPGDACIYPDNRPTAIITADCIKWTLSPLLLQHRFFVYSINSLPVKKQIFGITKGVAQLKVSLGRFERIAVPLPSLIEQQQIVVEVERRLSVIEQAEAAIETSLKRIERARQSILEQAFSGQLVPQDPHDEPASVLLERIQEERTRRVVEGKQCGSNRGVKVARGKKAKEQEFVPQWQLLRESQPSELVDGSLSGVSVHENGAADKSEVEHREMGKDELVDLVQMPLLWD